MTADTDGAVAPADDTTSADVSAQVIDLDEIPEESGAASDEGQASGETGADEAAELPPIEAPKFWKQSAREFFATLPRDQQEAFLAHDNEREAFVQRTKNETADKLKGLSAREQAAEQARHQYEAAVHQALQSLAANTEFADIKTPADERKVANEDPFRYAQYQAYRSEVASRIQQAQQIQHHRAQEQHQQFQAFAQDQDRQFIERNPDFSNPEKAKQIRTDVVLPYVREVLGISDQELATFWNQPHIRDVRSQQALLDAARWRAAQVAAKKAIPAAKPAPLKPGTSAAKGGGDIPALEKADMKTYIAMRNKGVGNRTD